MLRRTTILAGISAGISAPRTTPAPKRRSTRLYTSWQIRAGLVLACLTAAPAASAYTIQSNATVPCHEDVTMDAWRQVAETLPDATAPLPSRGDDEALMADVPFDVPESFRHIGAVTLLLGVRDNDVKDGGPNDLDELTPTASDPSLQDEHCLRSAGQDEPNGSAEAVEACRKFIRTRLLSALTGLDASGRPDATRRTKLRVSLSIRHRIDVEVPLLFLQAGRALHTIQDSFTHTFRNPDEPGKIRVVLNFVEQTEDTLVEAEDGPPHASELDDCEGGDEQRNEKRALATEASSVALLALLDPALSTAQKERAIDQMLDDYVAFDEGSDCSLENGWCDAPERQYGSPTLGCHVAPPTTGGSSSALLALGAAIALARLRRRRSAIGAVAAVALLSLAAPAHAQVPDDQPINPNAPYSPNEDVATKNQVEEAGAFFGRAAIGASYDNTALSAGAGLRYQLSRGWMLGFDAEWNPYAALSPSRLRSGSANAYLTLIRRFQLVGKSVNIRSAVAAGGSMLLFDLVGADKYSLGPYFGVSFLGVEWKAARGFYLTVDPTYIAIPIPNTVGVPFMYAQYRFLIGAEFGG
jgi:MYXO-CTERM domain-containing protein